MMDTFVLDTNRRIFKYLEQGAKEGQSLFALQGARRSGKTYTVCQWLLLCRMLTYGETIIFASMTAEQGRKGAYEDCKTILASCPEGIRQYFGVLKSPREIHCHTTVNGRQGVAYFASYQDPETAKGGACDWVFLNEANKFTKQQFEDLSVNARRGVVMDYNPQTRFWVDELNVEPLLCSWWTNRRHLTPAQLDWFKRVKRAAFKPNATPADLWYYHVYYLGEYCGLSGQIFNRSNIHVAKPQDVPKRLTAPIVFGDPSALWHADFFPLVLCALDSEGDMWVLDVDSTNTGTKDQRIEAIERMQASADRVRVFIEGNGVIGQEFLKYCHQNGRHYNAYTQTRDKFARIVANYHEITERVHFVDGPRLGAFLEQVYEFAEKCEHDDNIDAVNSAWEILQYMKATGQARAR